MLLTQCVLKIFVKMNDLCAPQWRINHSENWSFNRTKKLPSAYFLTFLPNHLEVWERCFIFAAGYRTLGWSVGPVAQTRTSAFSWNLFITFQKSKNEKHRKQKEKALIFRNF